MPVLVAGGGASGLVISIVLAGHGVGSLVVGPTDRLELTLLGHARTFGCIEIRPAAELVSFEQDREGVTSIILDRASGRLTEVRSGFLVRGTSSDISLFCAAGDAPAATHGCGAIAQGRDQSP